MEGHQAAYRFLVDSHPGVPGMDLAMATKKLASTPALTKHFVPVKYKKEANEEMIKYMSRPRCDEGLTLLEYLKR